MPDYYQSPVGWLKLDFVPGGLASLKICPAPPPGGRAREANAFSRWLDAYFSGADPDPGELPLAPAGTPYQLRIWNLLLRIPFGQTTSYGQLAKTRSAAGQPSSPRAVGQAVARNPIWIIIPCHRVILAGGGLGGYAGGAHIKTALLKHEQSCGGMRPGL